MNSFYPNVLIKRVNPDAPLPRYAHDGDAGMDLCSMEDVTLAPGETKVVGTGIAIAIPRGYVGLVFPRSGLGTKGLTLSNCVGVIDSGYRGEIRAPLHNNHSSHVWFDPDDTIGGNPYGMMYPKNRDNCTDDWMHVRKGERVCQIVFMAYGIVSLVEVDDLDATERGVGGFGSTGHGRL